MTVELGVCDDRLRVPKYGAILEFLNFVVLFVIFVLALSSELPSLRLLHEDVAFD